MGELNICWKCLKPISELNNSDEHIIPFNIGGRLKYKNILHEACNNGLSYLDQEIEKQFHPQILLSKIKSKRNKDKIYKVYDKDFNIRKMIDPSTLMFTIKLIKNDLNEINIIGIDINDALAKVKNLVKTFNKKEVKYDFEKIKNNLKLDRLEITRIFFSNGLAGKDPYKSMYGGPTLDRAVAKIAINFAMHQSIKFNIKQISDYINSTEDKDLKDYSNVPVRFFNPSYYNIYYPNQEEISHIICLKADKTSKTLIAYIELFNFECFLVLLDNNYNGPDKSSMLIQEINNSPLITNNDRFTRGMDFYLRAFEESHFSKLNKEQRLYDTFIRYRRFMNLTIRKLKQ